MSLMEEELAIDQLILRKAHSLLIVLLCASRWQSVQSGDTTASLFTLQSKTPSGEYGKT